MSQTHPRSACLPETCLSVGLRLVSAIATRGGYPAQAIIVTLYSPVVDAYCAPTLARNGNIHPKKHELWIRRPGYFCGVW